MRQSIDFSAGYTQLKLIEVFILLARRLLYVFPFHVTCNCAQFVLELRLVKICKQLFKNCFEILFRFHCWINQKEHEMKDGLSPKTGN